MTDLDPERFTLRQAAQARDDFAQIMDELDVRLSVHFNRSRHRLAKGAPNRNPEHESKRRAPSQQDADDNSAMPTAKFGVCTLCHRFRGTKATV